MPFAGLRFAGRDGETIGEAARKPDLTRGLLTYNSPGIPCHYVPSVGKGFRVLALQSTSKHLVEAIYRETGH